MDETQAVEIFDVESWEAVETHFSYRCNRCGAADRSVVALVFPTDCYHNVDGCMRRLFFFVGSNPTCQCVNHVWLSGVPEVNWAESVKSGFDLPLGIGRG